MKRVFGNSCATWCLAYAIAFVVIAVGGTWGLAGLKTRFGTSTQVIGSPITSTSAAPTAQPAPASSSGDQSTTAAQPTPVISVAPAQPQSQQPQPQPPPEPPAPQIIPPTPGPVQAQSGVISSDTASAFYIIQSGDTLWSIAQQYGVTVDELKSANGLADNIIVPGQVLYLPQGEQPQPVVAPTSTQEQQPTIPQMPHTGINKDP